MQYAAKTQVTANVAKNDPSSNASGFSSRVRTETEKEIMKKMLTREEEIVKLVLSSIYSNRLEAMSESLPNFIVTSSWGAFFGNKINNICQPDRILNIREFVFKSLENILS